MIGAIIGAVASIAGSAMSSKKQSGAVGAQNQMSKEMEKIAKENFGLNKKSYEDLMKQYSSLVQPGADFNLKTLEEYAQKQLPEQQYSQVSQDPFMQGAFEKVWRSGEYTPNYMDATGRVSDILKGGMNPMQQQAIDAMYGQGLQGSGAYNLGMGELSDVLGGKYLEPGSNPYIKATYDKAAGDLEQSANKAFGNVLNYFDTGGESWKSNSQFQEALGKAGAGYQNAMEDLATNIYGGNYNAERNRMSNMAGLAPTYNAMAGQNNQMMMNAGNLQTAIPLQMAQDWMGNEQNNELWNRQGGQAQLAARAPMLKDMNIANQVAFQNAMGQYQQPFNLGSWYSNMAGNAMNAMPRYNSVGVQVPNQVTDPSAYPNPFGQFVGAAQQGLGVGQQVQNAFGQGGGDIGYSGNPYLQMPSSLGNGQITSPTGWGFSFG